MKEFLIFLPLTILFLTIKSALFPNLPMPDLPLIIVFYMAYSKASVEGALMGFVLGYLDDAFNGGIIGSTSFALIFIFLTVHLTSKMMQFTTPGTRAIGAGIAALVKGALTYAVLRFTNVDVYFLGHVILQAIITGVFAPAIITLLMRLTSFTSPRRFKGNIN